MLHSRPYLWYSFDDPFDEAAIRHASSDSDSDYGARSKKKKKPRVSGDEIRVSSRGNKIPNYYEDNQDLAMLSEEEAVETYYVDPSLTKEDDEIEAVLSHCRDEAHEDDPEDLWYSNVVCSKPCSISVVLEGDYSVSISSGRIFRTSTTRMKHTSS